MSGRSKLLTWGLPTLGALTLGAGAYLVATNRPINRSEEPPRPPTTAPREDSIPNASDYIGAIGVSEPPREAIAIAAHVGGVIAEVNVVPGDTVTAGQTLFSIDHRRASAEVTLKKSEVDVAKSQVLAMRASIPSRTAMLASATAALESAKQSVVAAQADRDDAAIQFRRAEPLADKAAISAQELDTRRFELQQADARLRIAEAELAKADAAVAAARADLEKLVTPGPGGDGPDLLVALDQQKQAESALAAAHTELALHCVNSPIEGRVLQVNIRPGEFAPASTPMQGLVVLGRTGPTHLRVEIDEADIPRFTRGAEAWASPRGDSQTRLPIKFAYVEPLVTPKTNLSGRTSELIDTRVLQVVYELPPNVDAPGVGQQFDVYIATEPSHPDESP
jgi:HlyD family secretion protein